MTNTLDYDPITEEIESGSFSPGGAMKDKTENSKKRKIILTSAADIQMRAIRWLWKDRIAVGELTLLAGAPGLGKSTIAEAELTAWITTGNMKGRYFGVPKGVIIAATEDSWEHTIKPRLVGAGADLNRVFRCEVFTREDVHGSLEFPLDTKQLAEVIKTYDVKMVILDPLISRLNAGLDSHNESAWVSWRRSSLVLSGRLGLI